MRILPIGNRFNLFANNKNRTKKQTQNTNEELNYTTVPYQIAFGTLRVDKRSPRFREFNELKKRLPSTLKKYYDTLEDPLSVKPVEAMKTAYADLNLAKTIKDVQNLFPEEELFIFLTSLKNATSRIGLLGIYKNHFEDKDNKTNILRNGEDFTVYLLKKIFAEAKTTYKEINNDLDKDLNPEIQSLFRKKFKTNEYITTEVLRALEIYPPDQYFRNSLKFTQEGYSDAFGLIISAALLSRLKNLSEEEKNEEIMNRSLGFEAWWNYMTYEEKLELVAGIDSQEEVYKNYRKFANANRKINRDYLKTLPDFAEKEPAKKVKTGIKLNDKDIFILWMHKNLAKFYENASDTEKEVIALKRSKRQVQKWLEMTPEERTECINRMRTDTEPIRYVMYEAWNHSILLIRALSEFLTEKQVERPADMAYGTEEFKEFQSRIMTEFWENNRDLADRFSIQIKYAHTKIEDAIKNGTFKELKKVIDSERDERKKILESAKAKTQPVQETESQPAEKTEIKPEKKTETSDTERRVLSEEEAKYMNDFYREYRKRYHFLPLNYIKEMAGIMIETFPKDIIEKYTFALNSNLKLPQEIIDVMNTEGAKNNNPRLARIQRALETAIAKELHAKGGVPDFFGMKADTLIPILEKRLENVNLPKRSKIDLSEIDKNYNYFKRDLDYEELAFITNNYFSSKRETGSTQEEENILNDYIDEYGKTATVIFPIKNFSVFQNVRAAFNNKFLELMPQEVKDVAIPLIETEDDIKKESDIEMVRGKIAKRFNFVPKPALDAYTTFVTSTIRVFNKAKEADEEEKIKYSIENISEKLCNQHFDEDGGVTVFQMPKYAIINIDTRLKLLAAEQALAEELYKVTNVNEDLFSSEFENLAVWIEMITEMAKKSEKMHRPVKKCGFEFSDSNGTNFTINDKPSAERIKTTYREYIKNIYENINTVVKDDGTINEEELLYILNPEEKNEYRDEYILSRIKKYCAVDKYLRKQ